MKEFTQSSHRWVFSQRDLLVLRQIINKYSVTEHKAARFPNECAYQLFIHTVLVFPRWLPSLLPTCFLTGSDSLWEEPRRTTHRVGPSWD